MYSVLDYSHPELYKLLYYYEKAHTLVELHQQQKKAEEDKNMGMQNLKVYQKQFLTQCD